jgi:hypothetical protein
MIGAVICRIPGSVWKKLDGKKQPAEFRRAGDFFFTRSAMAVVDMRGTSTAVPERVSRWDHAGL